MVIQINFYNCKFPIGFWLLLLLVISSCNPQRGHRSASASREASIENKLFVADYDVFKNPVVINDTLSFDFKRVWLEKQWKYGAGSEIIPVNDEYQLIIETNQVISEAYGFDWTIGISSEKYLRTASKNDFIGDFDFLPEKIIKYKVQKGRKLKGSIDPKDIIGEITFIRTSEIINK